MRKVCLTEKQLQYCLDKLNEVEEQGANLNVVVDTDPITGNVTPTSLRNTDAMLRKNGIYDANLVTKQEQVREKYEMFTKKELKEARLQKLMSESKKYTKKELKNSKSL